MLAVAILADTDLGAVLITLVPWIGGIVSIVALVASLRACRRKRLIDNLPTSKAQGVFIGLVELKGTAQCAEPLVSYLAAVPCVYYAFDVQESWSRQVTETVTDEKGNTRTVTRTESGWSSVLSRTEMTPFYVQDETGSVLVRPEGARVEALGVFAQTCNRFDPLYYAKGPAGAIFDSDGVRRFTEQAIPVQAPVFLVGQARERGDVVAPEIAADPRAADFLISVRTEEQVSRGLGWRIWLFFFLGLVTAAGGHVIHAMAGVDGLGPFDILMFATELLLFFGAWSVGWLVTVYNSLVELRQRVEQGWAQVDIQLKRRHDLIPNLVDVVKGYRDHEAATQQALAAMRRQLEATPPGQAGDDPRSVQAEIKVLQEAYPALKADGNFLALQKELSDTESRIALARAYFNSITTFYNTRLEVVPDRFVAALGVMQPRALMQANDFERAAVPVGFQK